MSTSIFRGHSILFLIALNMFGRLKPNQPYFGLRGGWLTFWVTVACATDMMLFGYDQGVFGISPLFVVFNARC
jgi:hypothetical protein